ncbi:DUF2141 domain-containing protein [Aliidongia dinghuensis]|nr:DUF2141 domain-containing protein [Aliidongia dinghuensis]
MIIRNGAGTARSLLRPNPLRHWALIAVLALLGHAARADSPPACDSADSHQVRLQISVSGMHSAAGNITITIYPDDAAHFLDGKFKLARQSVPVTLPVTHACFAFAEPGYYAVALFHDENNSGHFETTMLGLPADGFGFSNNPTLYLGPPDLGKARFEARSGDNPIAIQMKYY